MTDETPTPPPAEPVAPAAPAYAAAPAAAGPTQTMSIVAFILGIGAFVFAWTAILGIGAGIAALIVRRRAKKAEPAAPSWMGLIALIGGIVGIVIGVIVGLVYVLGFIASILLPAAVLNGYGN